ncbi:hypothetical protein HDU76_005606 [Blyttiomyces sp. JEL0837]|nr:hypothetical protein HDU76_005606 [Blyttiomyces sp. JEL0837]
MKFLITLLPLITLTTALPSVIQTNQTLALEGESCEGVFRLSRGPECAQGLICDHNLPRNDAAGTCVKQPPTQPSQPLAQEGPECDAGLFCDHNLPRNDGAGTCVKQSQSYAQLNDHCGGNMVDAPTCALGLKCQINYANPDAGGKCVAEDAPNVSQLNGRCGGNLGVANVCADGLTCWSGSNLPAGDVSGTCKIVVQRGGICDKNNVCDFGLTCYGFGSVGICA